MALSTMEILNLFMRGAFDGVVIGLVVGAIVLSTMHAPDTMGRALLLALILGFGVAVFDLVRILSVTGNSFSELVNAFSGGQESVLGQMILAAATRSLTAMLIGAMIGIGSLVPGLLIRGGIIGVLLGGIAGGALRIVMGYFDFGLGRLLFRVLVAILTWGLLVTFVGND